MSLYKQDHDKSRRFYIRQSRIYQEQNVIADKVIVLTCFELKYGLAESLRLLLNRKQQQFKTK